MASAPAPIAIGPQRLAQQRLTREFLATPAEVVSWLGAVQSQEYQPTTWSLGMRMDNASDANATAIEQSFTSGAILRTHVMRPTWHFVTADDIRWLLELTAPRVRATQTYYDRRLELDDALYARSNAAIGEAVAGGRYRTRAELGAALAKAGIAAEGQRLGHIVMRAELDAVICSGPRRGKQFTYALLAERAPDARTLSHDEALAELTRRYFTGHGPATVRDFTWWSGLTVADARVGLALVGPDLDAQDIDGQTYYFPADMSPAGDPGEVAFLLPTYDEFLVGYSAFATSLNGGRERGDWPAFYAALVIGGRVVGNWRRTITKNAAVIEVAPFSPLSATQHEAILTAAGRYGAFFGVSVEVVGL